MRKSLIGFLVLAMFGFVLTCFAEEAKVEAAPEKASAPCPAIKKCEHKGTCCHKAGRDGWCGHRCAMPGHSFGEMHHCMMPGHRFCGFHRMPFCGMIPCRRFGGFGGMHHCMTPGHRFCGFHDMHCCGMMPGRRFGGFGGMHHCMTPGHRFCGFHDMHCCGMMPGRRFGEFCGTHKAGMKHGNGFGGFGTSVKRDENGIVYTVAMAGTPKEEVSVSTKGNLLLVDWKKTTDKDGKTGFANNRKFLLPRKANQEKIKATYKDGLLSVTVPVEKEPEIPVKAIQID